MSSVIYSLMLGIMRSFTSCRATEMDRLFWVSVLLIYLPVIGSMENTEPCLSQPKVMWMKTEQSVVLSCNVTSHCSNKKLQYRWFVFQENRHCEVHQNPHKFLLDGPTLSIKSLSVADSGIYHCAAVLPNQESAHKEQHIGPGTTLVVRERFKLMLKRILVWISFILMAIYSLAIVCLFILKKSGRHHICKKTSTTAKFKNSTKRMQFHDVLQELYSRRTSVKDKNTGRRHRPQVDEIASPEFDVSADEIYQNV